MKAEQLKEAVLRAEGYAEGFRAGYIACAKMVAGELVKEESPRVQADQGTAPAA